MKSKLILTLPQESLVGENLAVGGQKTPTPINTQSTASAPPPPQ